MHKPARPVSPETQKLCETVAARLRTPEGLAELRFALSKADRAAKKFREDSRVDPASLRIPMDI